MIKWFANKHHLKYNWIGYVAALIAIGGLIAQIETVYSRKSAGDLSYIHLGSRLIILSMWLVYGSVNRIPPTIFSGITGLILTSIVLGLKIHYGNKKKKDDNNVDNNTKSNYNSEENWGSNMWYIMHKFSYNYPNTPSQEEKDDAIKFINSIISLITCNTCKVESNNYIQNNPINVENKDNFIQWVLDFHNFINEKLHKVKWSREQLDKKYLF